jgi:hypothetical protein
VSIDRWLARGEDETAVWQSLEPGPSVDAVSTRLSSVPGDFLLPDVDLIALAGDVLGQEALDTRAPTTGSVATSSLREVLEQANGADESRPAAAIALWVWASEDVVAAFRPPLPRAAAARAIAALAFRLAPAVPVNDWLVDAERREEAARLLLLWAGALPSGEDVDTARARWERLDSLAHDSAMRAMLEEQRHRLEVQRVLREKRAAEAAARYTHE